MLLPILFLFKTKISDYFKYSKIGIRIIPIFLHFYEIIIINRKKECIFYKYLL